MTIYYWFQNDKMCDVVSINLLFSIFKLFSIFALDYFGLVCVYICVYIYKRTSIWNN